MNKFVILTYGRSGSTYLNAWLNNHYEIVCMGEIIREAPFKHTIVEYFKDRGNKTLANLISFIIRNPKKGILMSPLLSRAMKRYFDFVFSEFHVKKPDKKVTHPNYCFKIQGFKLIYRQLFLFWGLKKHILKTKIIHLIRKNVLEIYISRLVARSYNIYTSNVKFEVPEIKVPVWNLRWKLFLIKQQQSFFNQLIKKADHLKIYYEDFFSTERNNVEKKILSFLNVKYINIPSPKLIKLSSNKVKDRVVNYNEIVKVLRGSQFEYCLDQDLK